MATVTGLWNRWQGSEYSAELPLRIRLFVWLSTGMFSAAALAVAFVAYVWSGAFDSAATNFLASIASGVIFGVSSVLKFGPTEA